MRSTTGLKPRVPKPLIVKAFDLADEYTKRRIQDPKPASSGGFYSFLNATISGEGGEKHRSCLLKSAADKPHTCPGRGAQPARSARRLRGQTFITAPQPCAPAALLRHRPSAGFSETSLAPGGRAALPFSRTRLSLGGCKAADVISLPEENFSAP